MEVSSTTTTVTEEIKDPRLGTVLSERYRVTELLAVGSMGAVYRGEQIQLGKQVAIKFLHDPLLVHSNSRARFLREAQAMSKLSHPHCVSVIDYGIDERPYIVMDYVKGKSLRAIIDQEQISFARGIRIALQILAGLAHAHGQEIIHRDIKPANIVIIEAAGTGEHACILDFSLAKMADGSGIQVTGDSFAMGTPAYISPEQSIGEHVDGRTDLYSVGIVIFELLTGQLPFPGESITETLRMQRDTIAPSLGETLPSVSFSAEIEAVVKKALEKSPDQRFANAFQFMEELAIVPEAGGFGEILGGKKPSAQFEDSAETIDLPLLEDDAPKEQPALNGRTALLGRFPAARKGLIFGGLSVIAVLFVVFLVAVAITLLEETIVSKEESVPKRQPVNPSSRPLDRQHETKEKGILHAKRLIAAGQQEDAIAVLQNIRISDPDAPEPAYLLGNLFSEKSWWSAAINRYQNAIELNPDFAKDPILNQNLIRALVNPKSYPAARRLILEQIGQDAIPYLRKAIDKESSVRIRRRAAKLLKQMIAERPSPFQSASHSSRGL